MQFKEAIDQFSNWRRFKVKDQTVKGYDQTLLNFEAEFFNSSENYKEIVYLNKLIKTLAAFLATVFTLAKKCAPYCALTTQ